MFRIDGDAARHQSTAIDAASRARTSSATSSWSARQPSSDRASSSGARRRTTPRDLRAQARARSARRCWGGARPAVTASGHTVGSRARFDDSPSARGGAHRQVRALRLLSADVSDLRAVGRGDGFAARPDLPDEVGPRRARRDDRCLRRPLRRLSRLHGVRHRVPVGRAVRAADRGHARADRAAATSAASAIGCFARRSSRWCRIRGGCGSRSRRCSSTSESRPLLARSGLLNLLPERLRALAKLAPPVPSDR